MRIRLHRRFVIVTLIFSMVALLAGSVAATQSYGSYAEALEAYRTGRYRRIMRLKEPIIIEAESYINEGMEREVRGMTQLPKVTVVKDDTASGGAFVSGWSERFHYLEYEVTIPQTGLYSLNFGYRIPRRERDTAMFIRAIAINGVEPYAQAARLTVPKQPSLPGQGGAPSPTGDIFFTWTEQKMTGRVDQIFEEPYLFYLEEGTHIIRLTNRGGNFDFDYFRFAEAHREVPRLIKYFRQMWIMLRASFDMKG